MSGKVANFQQKSRSLKYSICEKEFSQHEPFVSQDFKALPKFLASALAQVQYCCVPGDETCQETRAWTTSTLCILHPPKDPECLSLSLQVGYLNSAINALKIYGKIQHDLSWRLII